MTHLTAKTLCSLALAGGLLTAMTLTTAIDIEVAPRILNLGNKGQVVTVHTSIDYGLVAGATVTLNGVEIQSWKSDDCGDFVAKFSMDAIKGLPLNINAYNTLTLTGSTKSEELFTGSSDVLVVSKGS